MGITAGTGRRGGGRGGGMHLAISAPRRKFRHICHRSVINGAFYCLQRGGGKEKVHSPPREGRAFAKNCTIANVLLL